MNESNTPATNDDPAYRIAWGVPSAKEPRWPASLAILAAIGLYLLLPARYSIGPTWLMPVFELSVLLPVTLGAPHRVAKEGRLEQFLAVAVILIVNIANLISLVRLINVLVFHAKEISGTELLFSAFSIWITNVIVFSLWYWEIDRGGPDQRNHVSHSGPDFLFPQMSTPGCSRPNWTPRFVDYLYLAFTNATAFSPTDAMPLTTTAKLLMFIQSSISLVTITLVAARAVNILN